MFGKMIKIIMTEACLLFVSNVLLIMIIRAGFLHELWAGAHLVVPEVFV